MSYIINLGNHNSNSEVRLTLNVVKSEEVG